MSQTAAFEAGELNESPSSTHDNLDVDVQNLRMSLKPTYRHGDGSAEVLSVELLNAKNELVGVVESGEFLQVRMRVLFHEYRANPVCGFLIRNRHGIHVYGTNTDLQQLDLGPAHPGDIIEVTFAFNGALGPDVFSISVAAHSVDNISFDWLDGVLFFRVTSAEVGDGLINLSAAVSHRRGKSINTSETTLATST